MSRNSFETAKYLLEMAQQEATRIAKESSVPISAECGIAEDEKGYVVTVRFRVPFAIADAVVDGENR